MGWWSRGMMLALTVGVSTAGIPEAMRAPGTTGSLQAVSKETASGGTPKVLYKSGAVPWQGSRILGFSPSVVLETFDTGIDTTAAGFWESIVDGNADGATWAIGDSVPGSGIGMPNAPAAVYDDDGAGSGAPAGTEALISKAIDFTGYQVGDTVFLRFYSDFQSVGSGEYAALAVQAFVFGVWGTWDTVWVMNVDHTGYEVVDLSAYAVADSIKLSFTFVDPAGAWGWGWGIDDLALGTFVSDILLAEDFEGCALPAGWTVVDDNGDGASWIVVDTTADSDISSWRPPNSGQCYAYYSDDDAGTSAPAGSEWLIAPAVGTAGYSNLGLAFDYGFRTIDEQNEVFSVYVRTHDGTAWGNWTEVYTYMGPDVALHEELDLSALLPAESVQVAFVYSDLDAGWYWAVGVDNVMLYEILPPTADVGVVSLDPGMYGVVPPSFTPSVAVKNFGLTDQTFQVHLRIDDTGGNALFHDSVLVGPLHAGIQTTVNFPAFSANVGDTLVITAWTNLPDDNPNNDQMQYQVVVVNAVDVAVTGITGPNYGHPFYSYTFSVDVANVGATLVDTVKVEVSFIDPTTSTVVQVETLVVAPLDVMASVSLPTAAFQPPDAMVDYTVQAVNLTADDDAANDTATFVFSTNTAPMGTVLASFTNTSLPNFDLAGITYRDDNGMFYVVSMNTPGVYELDPVTGTLNLLFTASNFGAPGGDIPWGIAFDPTDTTLWLTHIGMDANGNVQYLYAVKYDFTGAVLDTVDLLTLTGQGYIAGMDYFPRTQEPGGQTVGGYFWAVGVADPAWNAMATIWKLDLNAGAVVGQVANPDPNPYRGVAYYARGMNLVLLGGWNQGAVHVWDSTLTSQFASFNAPDMADLDLWEDLTHYQALAVLTTQTPDNTIQVVALGMPWQVSVEEGSRTAALRFAPRAMGYGKAVAVLNLPAAAEVRAEVFDATGRRVARVVNGRLSAGIHRLEWRAPKAGLYFWKVDVNGQTFTAKTVVVR